MHFFMHKKFAELGNNLGSDIFHLHGFPVLRSISDLHLNNAYWRDL